MLWHLQIDPPRARPTWTADRLAAEAAESGLPGPWPIAPAAAS